jgi:hypothetical protein
MIMTSTINDIGVWTRCLYKSYIIMLIRSIGNAI